MESEQGDIAPGDEIGSFVVEKKLGEGGFGAVYRGTHKITKKRVAIKALSAGMSFDPATVNRFRREAAAANVIAHENVADTYDFIEHGPKLFIVMELLEGITVAEDVQRNGPMPVGRALPILLQVADAMGAAHQRGIIHRDLKPENLFLVRRAGRNDFVKVLDFGVAKFVNDTPEAFKTRSTAIVGSPNTMSPEQCRGAQIDHRSDIYSLGVVAFSMLSGRYPFLSEFSGDLISAHLRDEPPRLSSLRPDIGPDLDAVIDRALAKLPSERFASMAEFAHALAECARAAPHRPTVPVAVVRRAEAAGEIDAILQTVPTVPPMAKVPLPAAHLPAGPASVSTGGTAPRRAFFIAVLSGLFAVIAISGVWAVRRVAAKSPAPAQSIVAQQPETPRPPKPPPPAKPEVAPPPPAVKVLAPPPAPAPPAPAPATAPAARGKIDIYVNPWATVFIDKVSYGDSPVTNVSLSAGAHAIELVNAELGFPRSHPLRKRLVVKSGRNSPISIDMSTEE